MAYHIVLSVPFDVEAMQRGAERDENPRHILYEVSRRLSATVHMPGSSPSLIDRALSKLIGLPGHWSTARQMAATLRDTDTVFCAGDDGGLPLVLACLARRRRPKIAIGVMVPERRRQSVLFRLLRRRIDLFVVNAEHKRRALQRIVGCPPDHIFLWIEQTDTEFFSPGEKRRRERPLIFAAGREQRDYRTLARATEHLDVDVVVCAISPNAGDKTAGAFPDPIPANMSFHPYPWPEFRQAYRDADVVVVSLLDHTYSAGATSMVEAMACRRPVVVTRIPGLAEQFVDGGYVTGVAPGATDDMRRAIEGLLADKESAEAQATRAHDLINQKHSAIVVREPLIEKLLSMGTTSTQG